MSKLTEEKLSIRLRDFQIQLGPLLVAIATKHIATNLQKYRE